MAAMPNTKHEEGPGLLPVGGIFRDMACAAVLQDSAQELDGAPLRLLVLGYLPGKDMFAFSTTSTTFRSTVSKHNEICKSQGQTPRVVKPPPASHFLQRAETTQWALDSGWVWPRNACVLAARAGCLAVLQMAREAGCPWDEATCSLAASGGHLEVLQWARSQGCPWNWTTCHSAAEGGHLEVLQWARSQGCPWDKSSCLRSAYLRVAYVGHNVIEWIEQQAD